MALEEFVVGLVAPVLWDFAVFLLVKTVVQTWELEAAARLVLRLFPLLHVLVFA